MNFQISLFPFVPFPIFHCPIHKHILCKSYIYTRSDQILDIAREQSFFNLNSSGFDIISLALGIHLPKNIFLLKQDLRLVVSVGMMRTVEIKTHKMVFCQVGHTVKIPSLTIAAGK